MGDFSSVYFVNTWSPLHGIFWIFHFLFLKPFIGFIAAVVTHFVMYSHLLYYVKPFHWFGAAMSCILVENGTSLLHIWRYSSVYWPPLLTLTKLLEIFWWTKPATLEVFFYFHLGSIKKQSNSPSLTSNQGSFRSPWYHLLVSNMLGFVLVQFKGFSSYSLCSWLYIQCCSLQYIDNNILKHFISQPTCLVQTLTSC